MNNYRDEDEFQRWRRHGHERGWFDRAADEVASWFGSDRDADQFMRDSRRGGSKYEFSQEERRPYGRDFDERAYGTVGPVNRWRLGGTEFGDFGTRPSHHGRGPRNYQRNDERIREDVIERLTRHHDIDATDVEIQVQGGEVTLRGMVEERREKRLAEDICEDIFGVKNVINHLKVRSSMGMNLGLPQQKPGESEARR